MSDDTQVRAESQNAEAVNAVAVAAEASQKAQAAQIEAALESAMARFFSRGIQEKRFIDVGRIPFICDDLAGIHKILASMSNDSKWVRRITAASAVIFLPAIGWLLLQVIKNTSNISALTHAAR
jgi:hypothetical protein